MSATVPGRPDNGMAVRVAVEVAVGREGDRDRGGVRHNGSGGGQRGEIDGMGGGGKQNDRGGGRRRGGAQATVVVVAAMASTCGLAQGAECRIHRRRTGCNVRDCLTVAGRDGDGGRGSARW